MTIAQLKQWVPEYVIEIAVQLHRHGYEAYLVGGCLRDILLGKQPSDYDIATNAYPEEIEKIFPRSIPTGAKFGTITVVGEDKNGERFDVEVTTYRSEADYLGGRWPTKVEFTRNIQDDLARRDFTINAMALNLSKLQELQTDNIPDEVQQVNVTDIIVDPFGGMLDLEARTIKAVGSPLERFSEDGLRPMRACRLASQLDFTIDADTFAAMQETNHVTKMVSVERLRDELMKLLLKSPQPSKGLYLLRDSGILALIIPELLEGQNITQPQFHVDDVFTHILKTVDCAEDEVKLAALFHDIAKPRTISVDDKGVHFYGHDILGAEMTREIMTRMRFANAEIDRVSTLVRWHMFYYPSADWRKQKVDKQAYRHADKETIKQQIIDSQTRKSQGGWTDAAIRRLIANVGGEEAIDQLMKLRIADATANPKSEFNPSELDVLAERIAEVRAKDMALKVTDLDITGHDLMQSFARPAGAWIGEVMSYLLDCVIEDPLLNQKEELIKLAGNFVARQE